MTHRLALATRAVGETMGQQAYEHQLEARAAGQLGNDWTVDSFAVRTMRSPLPGSVRLPSRVLFDASAPVRRAIGSVIYRRFDVVHRLDLRLPPAPQPEVLTIHDIVSWRYPDEGAPPADAVTSARRAAAVICPSQFSADEVATVLGVKDPVAIHNGVERRFFDASPLPEEELATIGVRPPFILHAGGCTSRKNLAGLAAAWPLVRSSRPDTNLVLMGPPDPRRQQHFGSLAGATYIGMVDDALVTGIMAAASVLVVPSTYEGFGLPALEAMAVGVPVVAAARSSLPEVCGDAALLVEPDGPGLAAGLIAALELGPDTKAMVERGRVRATGFTWEASAAAHAAQWRSCVG